MSYRKAKLLLSQKKFQQQKTKPQIILFQQQETEEPIKDNRNGFQSFDNNDSDQNDQSNQKQQKQQKNKQKQVENDSKSYKKQQVEKIFKEVGLQQKIVTDNKKEQNKGLVTGLIDQLKSLQL